MHTYATIIIAILLLFDVLLVIVVSHAQAEENN